MTDTRLHEFGPGIWIADGPAVPFAGFPYSTRMALIRLSDGGVFAWSPVALTDALRREVDRLGPVRSIVSPNRLHHLFLGEWKAAYPAARLHAPPGLRRKRKDLDFDGNLGEAPEPGWAVDIDQVTVHGSFYLTEVVFFHWASGTAIFGDLLQNFRPDWFKGWKSFVARHGGICAPHPGAPKDWRATFLGRRAARRSLHRILAWPIERVLIAHGDPADRDGAAFVRGAFGWLLGPPDERPAVRRARPARSACPPRRSPPAGKR